MSMAKNRLTFPKVYFVGVIFAQKYGVKHQIRWNGMESVNMVMKATTKMVAPVQEAPHFLHV